MIHTNDRVPRDVDLNLLRTFVAIYEQASVTRAAEVLRVSQPAVSHALTRLRSRFADRLFLRDGAGMRATPAAVELYARIAEPMRRIVDGAGAALDFDPLRTTRRYRIALTDLGETTLLPTILGALATTAPLAGLDVVVLDTERIGEMLARGEVDAAVASRLPRGVARSETLLSDRYGCLAPVGTPSRDGRIDPDAYRSMPWAAVAPSSGHTLVQEQAEAAGFGVGPRVTVRSFAALPALVAEHGYLAAVPAGAFAAVAGAWSAVILGLPYPAPAVEVLLLSSRAPSPAQQLLLDVVRSAVPGPPSRETT